MNDLQQHIRRFLFSEIPAGELDSMNAEYGLDLVPGDTFMDALAAFSVICPQMRTW